MEANKLQRPLVLDCDEGGGGLTKHIFEKTKHILNLEPFPYNPPRKKYSLLHST